VADDADAMQATWPDTATVGAALAEAIRTRLAADAAETDDGDALSGSVDRAGP
jgi:hypothetical protein